MMEIYEENNLLRVSLQAEINMRMKLEKRNTELSEKLAEAKQGLQETRNALTKLQTATEQMVSRRDEREQQLQKVISISKSYERRIAELETNTIKPEDVAKLNSIISNTKLTLMEKEEAVNELEKQLMKLQHQYNTSKSEFTFLEEEKHKIEMKFTNTLQRVNELESVIESQKEKIHGLERNEMQLTSRMREELFSVNMDKNKALESAMSQFQQERNFLEEKIAMLEKTLNARNTELLQANNTINELSSSPAKSSMQINTSNPPTVTMGYKPFNSPDYQGQLLGTPSFDNAMGSMSNLFPRTSSTNNTQSSFLYPDNGNSNTRGSTLSSMDLGQLFPTNVNSTQNSFMVNSSPQKNGSMTFDERLLSQIISLINNSNLNGNNNNTNSNNNHNNPGNNNNNNSNNSNNNDNSEGYYELVNGEPVPVSGDDRFDPPANGSPGSILRTSLINATKGGSRVSFNVENNVVHEISKDEASKDARRPVKSPRKSSEDEKDRNRSRSSSGDKSRGRSSSDDNKVAGDDEVIPVPDQHPTPKPSRKSINSGSKKESSSRDKEKEKEDRERKEREEQAERDRRDREEKERRDREDRERREKEKERERQEKERRDREEKERKDKERRERDEKEQREKEDRERRDREKQEKERKDREKKEKEDRERKEREREEKDRKDREEKDRKDKERKERKDREDREERERKEREEQEERERREKEERDRREREKEKEKEKAAESPTKESKSRKTIAQTEASSKESSKDPRESRKSMKQKSSKDLNAPAEPAAAEPAADGGDETANKIRDMKLEINKLISTHRDYKQKIKEFNDNFEKENGRQPNKDDRKKQGKDIFKTYHKVRSFHRLRLFSCSVSHHRVDCSSRRISRSS